MGDEVQDYLTLISPDSISHRRESSTHWCWVPFVRIACSTKHPETIGTRYNNFHNFRRHYCFVRKALDRFNLICQGIGVCTYVDSLIKRMNIVMYLASICREQHPSL